MSSEDKQEEVNEENITKMSDMEGVHQLSDQAVEALMLTFQKALAELANIEEIIRDFNFIESEDGLVIENPPTLDMSDFDPEKIQEELEDEQQESGDDLYTEEDL